MDNFLVIGHRGATGYEPENTLRSFEKALQLGCSWIELDVHVVDDQIVVIHDDDLSRTTNGFGLVSTSSFKYLRSLDAGKGEQVPTLQEVMELIGQRCRVNVELKGKGTARVLSTLLRKRSSNRDQFLVSSFDHSELAQMDPQFRRGAIWDQRINSLVRKTIELSADTLVVERSLISASLVEEAQGANLQVFGYTINESSDVREMLRLGLNGIFTDFPDQAILSAKSP